MSDKSISQLPASTTPLAGTEQVAIVQSGDTKKSSVASFVDGRTIAPIGFQGNSFALRDSAGVQKGLFATSLGGSLRIQGQTAEPVTFWVNNIQRLTIDNSANVTVNGGNLVIGTSGKGIDFSADGQAAGMTSELLDDYEEGTWSPQVAGTTTDGTFTTLATQGLYTKVGRVVHFQCYLAWNSGTGTGNLLIKGLPFNNNLSNNSAVTIGICQNLALSANNVAVADVAPGFNYVNIRQNVVGGGSTTRVPYDSAAEIMLTGTYQI